MDAIEQAIRNAFAKGDPADPAFREKVYRWAYSVVDRTIAAKPNLAPDDAARQRRRALVAIERVESEFQPAAEGPPPAEPAQPIAPPPGPAPEAGPAPAVGVEPPAEPAAPAPAPEIEIAEIRAVDAGRQEPPAPSVGPGAEAPRAASPDWPDAEISDRAGAPSTRLAGDPEPEARARPAAAAVEERPRRRLPWGLLMGLVIVAVVAVLAIWTAAELGLVRLQPGGSAAPDGAPSGEAAPGSDAALEDWIVVFSPSDPTTVTASAGADAEVVDTGDGQAMRISSGSSGAAVVFDIGQGVLERLAGRRAIFDIVAQTGDGPETQMSVTCSLGELGECGRNRYRVGKQPAEYLFEVDVPEGAPGAGGTIAIVSDVDNGGKAVEIVEIRVTSAPGE